jgi:hypothetical protein
VSPINPVHRVQRAFGKTSDLDSLSLSAILMLERDPNEAAFVWSLMKDVLRTDVWLWHEVDLEHAVQLLSYCRFRLILLDSTFGKRVSARALVRRVQAAAGSTPILLRLPPEEMPPSPDVRLYGVAGVVPMGVGTPTIRAVQRLLALP